MAVKVVAVEVDVVERVVTVVAVEELVETEVVVVLPVEVEVLVTVLVTFCNGPITSGRGARIEPYTGALKLPWLPATTTADSNSTTASICWRLNRSLCCMRTSAQSVSGPPNNSNAYVIENFRKLLV